MYRLWSFTKRNLGLFFSNKASVFFSLMGAFVALFIVIVLLRSSVVDGIMASTGTASGLSDATIGSILDTWLICSSAAIASFTTGFAAYEVFVADRQSERWRDFLVTPMPRTTLTGGYLLAAIIVSLVETSAVYGLGTIYCLANGATLTWAAFAKAYGLLVLCCLSFTALTGFIISFVSTQAAFTGLSVVFGTTTGFLNGTYVQPSLLSDGVNSVFNSLPFAQAAAVVRDAYVAPMLTDLPAEAVAGFRSSMGIDLFVGDKQLPQPLIFAVLIGLAVVCSLCSWMRINRKVG
ncbi:MAG: hypothetical protein LBH11_06465 [Propionibacteriaceae bacterium]|jgi:multidrug/hemolysin transport system permease protein|nr:hypothetical protein [Propionibacteriaceae bacterium]